MDSSSFARLTANEALGVKGLDHIVDRWRCGPKETLHVALGGRYSVELRVVVDEGEILPLFWCVVDNQILTPSSLPHHDLATLRVGRRRATNLLSKHVNCKLFMS